MIELKENEEIIEIVKKSFFIILGPFLKAVFLSTPAVYFLFYLDNSILNIISFVWLLILLSYLFYHLINWYFDTYILTNKRIIELIYKGIFSKKVTEMPLERIDNSNCKVNGIIRTVFGFGNVSVFSISKADITLEAIPDPRRIQNLISEIKEKYASETKTTET